MEEEHTIVRFEDVWYHYPRTKAWSLKEITLSIKKGEFIAVIGENGAGKRHSVNA